VVAAAAQLERLQRDQPERLVALRERVHKEQVEVCGGAYLERTDALLPLESQLWNLRKGLHVSRELLGTDVRVFARQRFAANPQVPLLLTQVGLNRALLLTFDEGVLPHYHTTVVNWSSPDGKQVDAFTRKPQPADSPQTFFNLAHYLAKTIREDHAATLALLHTPGRPAQPWYRDWLELSALAPLLGKWTTFSRYFNEVLAGEHTAALSADEFQDKTLENATASGTPHPVSTYARHARDRRQLDTIWTLAALHRSLAGSADPLELSRLPALEDKVESQLADGEWQISPDNLQSAICDRQSVVAGALAERLQARAAANQPGYLLLNPCSFARRVALELDGGTLPLPITGPVKACQLDGSKLRLVVEVPALGFAWFPQAGPPGTPPPAMRLRLADERRVRNEFFEAEIDPATGGLREIRDQRTGTGRLGQRLIWGPGSTMRATSVQTTSVGPALGEIVTEGALLGEHEQVLARFRQRFRAWLGRPILEMRMELFPEQKPAGYPWHAYYGARFAWRDERAMLLRSVNGTGYLSSNARPQTPDYLELRMGRHSTVLFPGGLPFHQRFETRMLDVILIPEGETANVFDLALGLDREYPMQTALGLCTPVPLVPTSKGPPHVGATGWLFHLDATHLLLTGMRPGGRELEPTTGKVREVADALTARILECGAQAGQAELRCVRNPRRALLLDARGVSLMDAGVSGDAVLFDVAPGDLLQLQVEFG
jgi:hypothetical protein